MFTAEPSHTPDRWQVVDDSLPMLIPICECANRQWAKDIAATLNRYQQSGAMIREDDGEIKP